MALAYLRLSCLCTALGTKLQRGAWIDAGYWDHLHGGSPLHSPQKNPAVLFLTYFNRPSLLMVTLEKQFLLSVLAGQTDKREKFHWVLSVDIFDHLLSTFLKIVCLYQIKVTFQICRWLYKFICKTVVTSLEVWEKINLPYPSLLTKRNLG